MANKLLSMRNHTFYLSPKNGRFGFDIKRNYSGLMAQPAKMGKFKGEVRRPKQGLFDIVIDAGDRYENVSHRELFPDLLKYSTENKCLRVWRGENPLAIGRNDDEKESLTTLALLMFEQEVNWGRNEWQKSSNFDPFVRNPTRRRPRDMIMGYVRQAFAIGIDKMKYWMRATPGTIWFFDKDESPWGFQSYPAKYKRYFTELEDMNGTEPVMIGDILKRFKAIAGSFPNNPYY
ncbi:hypothetical protein ACFLXH_00965 [Chloroflexota bacterium]